MLVCQEHGEIIMKEFVRYGARSWMELHIDTKQPYVLMADVDKIRYERDKQAFVNGGVHGPLDLQLQQAQIDLAQKLSNYKPNILVKNCELMKNTPLQRQAALSAQMPPELQAATVNLQQLEKKMIQSAQSALYFFDQDNRVDLLKETNCTTAEEAYGIIKSKFD